MQMQAVIYAVSQHNQQSYERISSRCTRDSAGVGSDSQAFTRAVGWTAAAGTPRKGVKLLARIDRPMRWLLAAAG